jgi:hypothetical protein
MEATSSMAGGLRHDGVQRRRRGENITISANGAGATLSAIQGNITMDCTVSSASMSRL